MNTGSIALVSTPIGNLTDISERALDALRDATVVYAEDTRRTRKLFARYGIDTPLKSLHAHNEASRADEVVERATAGDFTVLVTDAGTPSVSDPGLRVVRAAVEAGVPVTVVPGPSAVLAALTVSGFDTETFAFLGFPPRKGADRKRWIAVVKRIGMTAVLFESPVRVGALLCELGRSGLGARDCAVCRELTKLHEEVRRGTVDTLADYYIERKVRGEVTVVIAGPVATRDDESAASSMDDVAEKVAARMAESGMTSKEITHSLREDFGLSRNRAYDICLRSGVGSAD